MCAHITLHAEQKNCGHTCASVLMWSCKEWRCVGQVGGYVEQYHGLTFATVRNAGHMVRCPSLHSSQA